MTNLLPRFTDGSTSCLDRARSLIPLDRLADAALRTANPAELARRLRVDEAVLRDRLTHLHPAERAQLRRVVTSLAC